MSNIPRPPHLPSAWPTDGRSKMELMMGNWIIAHPERIPQIYKDGKWEELTNKTSLREEKGAQHG